jgi:hypothetical protein
MEPTAGDVARQHRPKAPPSHARHSPARLTVRRAPDYLLGKLSKLDNPVRELQLEHATNLSNPQAKALLELILERAQMIDIGRLIADDLEYGAEWRHLKSIEFPHDANRNLAAAETLERIAAEFRKLEGSQYHWRLQALSDRYGERFVEALNSMIAAVGFRSSAETAEEFLDELCLLVEGLDEAEGDIVPIR